MRLIIIIISSSNIHRRLAHGVHKNITPTHKSSSLDENNKKKENENRPITQSV